MRNFLDIEFSGCMPVNYLWPNLIEKIGLEKAQRASRQALDLQSMHGNLSTLPVLLFETCGLALASIELIRCNTGLSCYGDSMILILSTKDNLVQLLREF